MRFRDEVRGITLWLSLPALILMSMGCGESDIADEEIIKKTIDDSFGWAIRKDRALFESVFARDESFFTYYPDSKSTVRGWKEFEQFLDRWMDPRNTVTGYEIRDLALVMSQGGDVAWFSAVVDDSGEWDGEPWSGKDIRWTGVLERRNDRWVIVQQHMSEAKDKVIEEVKNETVE